MQEYIISGIPVNFPFEPYDVQKAYMAKVIECLDNSTNGVLESPTGTGKTLSLLCSTLAWILNKRAQVDSSIRIQQKELVDNNLGQSSNSVKDNLLIKLNEFEPQARERWNVPKIIYASRTHSQLSQAMQELKQTAYSGVKAVVLGSRDQLCIHPEVSKELNNSTKIQMCKLRIVTRTCTFYNRVEKQKDSAEFRNASVLDIEDLVKVGQKLRVCPYFVSKELVQDAAITFMPYNYLLDPKARQMNKIDLTNAIIILDEAHNVEKMCEESASIQIKSSDIAVAIDDVTHAMKVLTDTTQMDPMEEGKDLSVDDLAFLKEMLLEFEKAVDEIEVPMKIEGVTFPGGFIFELLAKANIHAGNYSMVNRILEDLVQFLAVAGAEEKSAFRKGNGIQILADLLTIVFVGSEEDKDKVLRCFKVYVEQEEESKVRSATKKDGWITPKAVTSTKIAKVINYWCFNPGFGMEQLLGKKVRSIILTSGTLAPLKPLIAELGIPVSVRLENPHIVGKSQVCVKIVASGPDKEPLNSNYRNRDNPKYISSLGRTILSFCPVIPDGLLIFFPSYPLMNKCIDSWQASGIWSQINRHKPIFVEPRSKEAFSTAMADFYVNINDPNTKGACFMAVCRGKVSEGLDFADMNGRAVIITGLPYPPLKDPRVVLKKKYLEDNRTRENELLSGDNWYGLEATRAVNQAIGRVIRHKNDYGAILLCDSRFNYPNQKSQLSAWIQEHLQSSQQHINFGPLISDISRFFRNAGQTLPQPCLRKWKPLEEESKSPRKFVEPHLLLESKNKFIAAHEAAIKIEKTNSIKGWSAEDYSSATGTVSERAPSAMDFMSRLDGNVSTIDFNKGKPMNLVDGNIPEGLVTIHKRDRSSPISSTYSLENTMKRKKLKIIPTMSIDLTEECSTTLSQNGISSNHLSSLSLSPANIRIPKVEQKEVPEDRAELLKLIKSSLPSEKYSIFVKALMAYQKQDKFDELFSTLLSIFGHPCLNYLLRGMRRFIKDVHKKRFDDDLSKKISQ